MYLDEFSKAEQVSLLSAFASSLHRKEFGKHNKSRLTGNTFSSTITHVCLSFRTNLRPDPNVDGIGQRALTLKRQINGYIANDPAPAHEKCLPLSVFTQIASNKASHLTTAIGELVTVALFYGIRSCEYSSTTGIRKTKLLLLENIHFFTGNKQINKVTELHRLQPDKVSVTFSRQKNNMKDVTITVHKTDKLLCPVRAWRSIVLRILAYPNSSLKSSVNTIRRQNKTSKIKNKTILQHIRNTVDILGTDLLGFSDKDVGTHSIRSSFAMFLYLNSVRSDKIMMQGRWKSQAFLQYIRTQVSAFSNGLSLTMLTNTQFFTIPSTQTDIGEHNLMFNPEVTYLNDELYPADV